MATTIQISNELLERLGKMKMSAKESYENIIWDLLEDRLEFSEQTKRDIAQSEREIKEGRTISLHEVRKKLKM